jgi:hypothetical protein
MSQIVNSNVAVPANSPDAPTLLGKALNAVQTEIDTTLGAIAILNGKVILNAAGALAMTLAAPTVTTDDFKVLKIVGITAQAHTVTTPANKLNGNKHIITYAAVGDSVELMAYQGVWYILNSTTTNT